MTVLASGNFTGADVNPLPSPWTQSSSFSAIKRISNAAAAATASTDSWMWYSGPTYPNDQYAKVTVSVLGGLDCGCFVRHDGAGSGYYITPAGGATHIDLYKVVSGSFNLLNSFSVTPAANDVFELRVTGASPAALQLWVNGTQIGATINDAASPFTSGVPGMGFFDGTSRISAFEFGDFAAASPPTITSQPSSQRVSIGLTATFTVVATGATSYQWQSNASGSFVDISGETSATYTTGTLVASLAYAVRCNCINVNGTTTSDPADLWTPVVKSRSWQGLYSKTNRQFTTANGLIPNSKVNQKIFDTAIWGTVAIVVEEPRIIDHSIPVAWYPSSLYASTYAYYPLGIAVVNRDGLVTITGTFSSILDNTTLASTGIVNDIGNFASTLDGVIASFSGNITNVGSFSSTLGNITSIFSGTVGNVPTGTFASTLADTVASFTGTIINSGSFASTLGNTTGAFSGSVVLSGTFSSTLDNTTSNFSGAIGTSPTGTFASVLDNTTSNATIVVTINGTFSSVLESLSSSFTGQVTNQGTFSSTLANTTGSFSGVVGNVVSGTFSSTLDNTVSTFSGTVPYTGTFASTLGNTILSFSGTSGAGGGGSANQRTMVGVGI